MKLNLGNGMKVNVDVPDDDDFMKNEFPVLDENKKCPHYKNLKCTWAYGCSTCPADEVEGIEKEEEVD